MKTRQPTPGTITMRFSSSGHFVPRATGNRYVSNDVTLQDLIAEVYDVKDYQLAGLPDWATAPLGDHFDIASISERGPPGRVRHRVSNWLPCRGICGFS